METENRSVVDYEEVLRVLPQSFQNIWKENPDVLVYLSDLGSLGIQRLSQEPDRLAEEKGALLEQTQDLAFHNYKTFIQAADCSHEIFQEFNIVESRLETLLKRLPNFGDKCREFGKETQQINARWRQASSTLAKHPQLLEFLEMPQLMENYVKGGLYDEALELSAYVKRLERKHNDIPLVKSIVCEVQAAIHVMLLQLLEKLRMNIQLPECLKVVGYLRRLDCFNETELRIKFLQARDAWFQKVITNIDGTDAYQHAIKVIENSRIHLFDIITQYRAIFSDDDSLLLVRGNSNNDCTIFQSWITWKISQFLLILEKDLSFDLGGRVDSVLAQCMYFGLSFSRVNIDFRPLLVPIFQKSSCFKFKLLLNNATLRFEQCMQTFTITTYTNTMFLMPCSLSEETLQPPSCLLDFYPLAQYCNDVLCGFNELKLNSSFAMASDIISLVEDSLKCVVKKMVDIYSMQKFTMNEKENELFIKLCVQFSTDLVPHLDKCLLMLFPPEEICFILGVTSLEFKKLEYLYRLNSKYILEPLQEILPSKSDDDMGLMLTIDVSNEPETSILVTKEEFQKDVILKSDVLADDSKIIESVDNKENILQEAQTLSCESVDVNSTEKNEIVKGTEMLHHANSKSTESINNEENISQETQILPSESSLNTDHVNLIEKNESAEVLHGEEDQSSPIIIEQTETCIANSSEKLYVDGEDQSNLDVKSNAKTS